MGVSAGTLKRTSACSVALSCGAPAELISPGRLLDDIRQDRIDCIVVYKIDRLSRSLMDFAKLVDVFDAHNVTFVSVTQSFNTTTSMGRLTLNRPVAKMHTSDSPNARLIA